MNTKSLVMSIFAFVVLVFASVSVSAVAYSADPYDGVNRIGTYYQYTNTATYNYEPSLRAPVYSNPVGPQVYDYVTPPRAGGWFGSGTEWLVGLRSPVYTQVPPVHYTNYYQPTCGFPCYFDGNYGYPRATAADFPGYRTRLGGVFGY
jgi:hypothetical protein